MKPQKPMKKLKLLTTSTTLRATMKNKPKISSLSEKEKDPLPFSQNLPKTELFKRIYTSFVRKPLRIQNTKFNHINLLNDDRQHLTLETFDEFVTNNRIRQKNILSNWSENQRANIISKIRFKAGKLHELTPLSLYTRVIPNKLMSRPYNAKESGLGAMMQDYRTRIFTSQETDNTDQHHKAITAFVPNKNRNSDKTYIKAYKDEINEIIENYEDLPYAQVLGSSIGKLNPFFLPWIRKRGTKRTHFFRQRKPRILFSDEKDIQYSFLLRKRPSRFLKPAKLHFDYLLTNAQRRDYVLAQLQRFPIKTQNSFLKILIYT